MFIFWCEDLVITMSLYLARDHISSVFLVLITTPDEVCKEASEEISSAARGVFEVVLRYKEGRKALRGFGDEGHFIDIL